MATKHWGLLDVEGAYHHVRLALAVRKLAPAGAVVHCARALPEGVAAWLSHSTGGPPYISWSHGEDIASARQSREFTWLITRVCHGAAAHLANSRSTGRMLEGLGVPAARIHVVYPGVDSTRFRPDVDGSEIRARHGAAGQVILLSVGRLQRRKGHDHAIAAIAQLDRSIAVRYLVVGDGEERARLEALAGQYGVRDRVTFLGEVPADDLPRYYAACDIFLMPNRIDEGDVEGFGIVFLEAAAAGKPSIGGRSGGVPEAVAEGETGMLVSGTDTAETAEAIRSLATSEDRRRSLGARARARVCRDFTWERAASEVATVHRLVADASQRGGPR